MTSVLILAAGSGTRLGSLTKDSPKCMVEYFGKKIIDWELEAISSAGVNEIGIVTGYKSEVLQKYLAGRKIDFFANENFSSTNMVASFFCARQFLENCIDTKSDLIASYADIIYSEKIIDKLKSADGNISIVVDKNWRTLWERRFDNPLSDAETLKIENGKIIELGKKPNDYYEIQAQYIGLFKFRHDFLSKVLDFYDALPRAQYDGRDFEKMFMTTFLQLLIDKFGGAFPVEISGGWAEIDAPKDLQIDFRAI